MISIDEESTDEILYLLYNSQIVSKGTKLVYPIY